MKLWLCILAMALPFAAGAQHAPMSHTPAIQLDEGLSDRHYPVSTKNAEAQRYFDQGLRYIYAFNHEAAIRSFQRAAELDPSLAMAHWGIALALGPNINLDIDAEREKLAVDALRDAQRLAPGATEKERDLIAAVSRRYSGDPAPDRKQLNIDYSQAMAALAKKYPDDLEIATLYAESLMDLRPWKFWTRDGKPEEGTEEIVAVLESVLARDPKHVGANHYYIHAVEASPKPDRAVKSADRLRTLAPAAGHLVHMPAHIDQRTGNYAGAAAANEAGARADRAFMKKYGEGGIYPLMYYNHNLHFGALSYAMAGRYADAKRMADEVGSNAGAMAREMPMVEAITATPTLVRLRFGKWMDIIRDDWQPPGPFSAAMRHFARGVAFAHLGNVAGAESEQKAFEGIRATLSTDTAMFQNSVSALGGVAARVLDGKIAMARGETAKAIASLREAVELEDQLNYNEPPDWFYPVRESLGATLLRNGDAAEAERVFRDDLARNPKNPRSLFGLSESLEAQKKNATQARAEFRKAWSGGAPRIEDF